MRGVTHLVSHHTCVKLRLLSSVFCSLYEYEHNLHNQIRGSCCFWMIIEK